jgi:hypothetical protein
MTDQTRPEARPAPPQPSALYAPPVSMDEAIAAAERALQSLEAYLRKLEGKT